MAMVATTAAAAAAEEVEEEGGGGEGAAEEAEAAADARDARDAPPSTAAAGAHAATDEGYERDEGGAGPASGRPRPPPSPPALDSDADEPPAAAAAAAARPRSRSDAAPPAPRYSNLSYWRARRVTFYRNGDPFFPGVEVRFKPGRDISSLEALLDRLSSRLELPRGARYIFGMDGDRKFRLDELEDGASYVVSSYKIFKAASYGKKNGMWYAAGGGGGGASVGGSWGRGGISRKASIVESDVPPPGGGGGAMLKPSSGRVIRIINNMDHSVQCRVLLNLRTTQPFEEVLEDLGQVLKMSSAKRMYTANGQEVRSFSQLRNEFADVETFYLGVGSIPSVPAAIITTNVSVTESPMRRSRSRATTSQAIEVNEVRDSRGAGRTAPAARSRARSKSRPRILYAPDGEIIRSTDYSLLEVMKEDPVRVTIKGLRRTFYPPMHHPPIDNSPPEKKLILDWVFGYRGADSRRNLWVLPTGELLYYVAAVAIMYDRDEDTQRHYIGHTEEIQCMELHPSRELVASGQRAGRGRKTQAHIRIWSTDTLQTLYVFGMGEFEIGVSAVAFSQLFVAPDVSATLQKQFSRVVYSGQRLLQRRRNVGCYKLQANGGSYVLAVDGGRESILSVWQWQWGHLLGKVATLQEDLMGAAFHPLDDNLLITHGKGHLSFWNRRKDGFFERTDIIKPPSRTNVTCLQFEQDGDVITADSDGFITIYSVDSDGAYFVRMEFEAHNKGISSLIMLSEGTLLSGGEKDRKIAAWDSLQNYKRITDTKLPESVGGVRTIYPQRPGRNDGNIYVGTTRNYIMEGSLQRRFNQVVFGHSRQLMGIATHPDEDLFATAGHDKNIALWRGHKLVWVSQVAHECVSLAWCVSGAGAGTLAAGTSEGALAVLSAESGASVITQRVCGSPLNCLAYSPAGDLLAIGSQNGSVYIFRVSRDGFSYKKLNKIRGTQPLMQLDWSVDGAYIQTVTADYDLAFWDVKSLSPEKSPIAMKDVKWSTHNCTVGFLVAGLWNNRFYPMTSLITTASRSFAHDLLVSGDTDGYLRLFRYPCVTTKAEYNEVKVYSGATGAARWLADDRRVVSAGGADAALLLWALDDE